VLAGRHEVLECQGCRGDPDGCAHRRDDGDGSLPDFDPNDRPRPQTEGDPSDSPLFNRAVQGVYELGSTFKIFAAAQALEVGLVNPDTVIDIRGPLRWGKHRIVIFTIYGRACRSPISSSKAPISARRGSPR
jgi:hypothetical protein